MDETLTIRLGAGLAKALEDEARHTGLSKGQIAREALESRLIKTQKASVIHKYIGCIKGPKDLSYNKEYRRQWKAPRQS